MAVDLTNLETPSDPSSASAPNPPTPAVTPFGSILQQALSKAAEPSPDNGVIVRAPFLSPGPTTDSPNNGSLTLQTPAAASPVAPHQAIARAVDAISSANPEAVSKPGGFARALIGGLMNFATGLGDVSTEKTEPGQGFLTGMVRTAANRNARLAAEQKAQTDQDVARANIAHENAQMVYEQKLTHQLDEADRQQSITNGKAIVKNWTSGDDAAPIYFEDVTSDELQTQLAQRNLDPTTTHTYPTGTKQTGEDKDGNPILRTTYTVIGDRPEVTVDDDTAKFLNSNIPGQKIEVGQVLPGDAFGHLTQQAANNAASTAARNKFLTDSGIASDADAQKLETVTLGPDWNNALAHAANDPIKALAALQTRPNILSKYPHLYQDVVQLYGGQVSWNEALKNAREADPITKLENNPDEMAGDKTPAVIGYLQNRLTNDPSLQPADRARATRLLAQANATTAAQKLLDDAKEKAKQALVDGDPKAAAQLLVNGDVSPSQITSARKPEFAQAAFTDAKLLDPSWNAAQAEVWFTNAKSPQNEPFFGSANSLLNKGGTLDQLTAQSGALQNGQFPFFNTLGDYLSYQTGDSAMAGFVQTALGVSDDYAKVMGGGTGSDTARLQALQSFSNAHNPQQMAAAISAARNAVTSQRDSRIGTNPILRKTWAPETITPTIPAGATLYRDATTKQVTGYVLGNRFYTIPAGAK